MQQTMYRIHMDDECCESSEVGGSTNSIGFGVWIPNLEIYMYVIIDF